MYVRMSIIVITCGCFVRSCDMGTDALSIVLISRNARVLLDIGNCVKT